MDLFQKIKNMALLDDAAQFELFQAVTNAINSDDPSQQERGRSYLIKVIDVWENVPSHIKPIWEDLIEAIGFYPYIAKYKMFIGDLDARIRQEYHKSEYIPNKIFHRAQKELSELVLSKRNVIVSAPTSFGKSLLIEEIVAAGIYQNIVIIQPTLALLDETRIKLKSYSERYKIIVRTSQEFSLEKGNIFLLTAERVLEYPNMPPIDLLIIKPINMDRYQKFDELPKDLQLILKRNAVSIRDQLELLPVLKQIMLNPMRKGDVVWSSPRDSQLYNHLVVIFELVKNRFVEGKDKNVLKTTIGDNLTGHFSDIFEEQGGIIIRITYTKAKNHANG